METPEVSFVQRPRKVASAKKMTPKDAKKTPEVEEEEVDLSGLGPNPTPQMIELKKKQHSTKKSNTASLAQEKKSSIKLNAKKALVTRHSISVNRSRARFPNQTMYQNNYYEMII